MTITTETPGSPASVHGCSSSIAICQELTWASGTI